MANPSKLDIVTPEGVAVSDEVHMMNRRDRHGGE